MNANRSSKRSGLVAGVAVAMLSFGAGGARGQGTAQVSGSAPMAAPAPVVPPPPYSLPWQLRGITPATVLRSDTSAAFYENAAGESGSTLASMLLASYKVTPTLAPMVRLAVVLNSEPGPALGSGAALVNPILGVTYGRKIAGAFKGAAFLGVTVPVGMGGDKASAMDATAAAVSRGIAARSAMDNAMFAVNYETVIVGADVGWIAHGVTLQAEATLLQLFRVRNEMFAPESTRTNLTMGLHAGYFIASFLSLGAEGRYQRWLSTPKAVAMNPAARDTTTLAIGPRLHFKAGGLWLRPGISYSTAVDKPLRDLGYHIVQVDLPVVF